MPTAAIKYALEEKNLVSVYDSNLLFFPFSFLFFPINRAPINEKVKHSSSSLLLTLS